MKKIHAKSACCKANVIRYGHRRKQCTMCQRTWRIRRKKEGRKLLRGQTSLLVRFLNHAIGSSMARANHKGKSPRTLQRQLTRSRDLYCRNHPWPTLSVQGPLIVVADAMVKRIRRRWYTVYCMFVRTIHGKEAVIAPPVILQGLESQSGWQRALDTLPRNVLSSIRAMVCDGHRGLVYYAWRKRWLVQRCHFHLLASIQGRRSRFGRSRHRIEGEQVYRLARAVLDAKREEDVNPLLIEIENIALSSTSRELKKILKGFVNYAEDYRTYRHHPELLLPRTSNTGESFIGCIESMLHRMRGVSTISAMQKWIEALVKFKHTIICNGFHQPS